MQQIIAIHGGTTFAHYEDFIDSLSTKTLYPERFAFQPGWKELLQQNLGADYQVLLPSMPNKSNAKYEEWKLWFEHFSSIAENGCVLIGHSLGAIFLAKYLSENTFPKRIKATILVAAPYDDETLEDLTDFKLSGVSSAFAEQAGETTFFFGSDDPVVPVTEMDKFQRDVPSAEFVIMAAPDHFVRADFPEIIDRIKTLV